jgi:hypothetical protein
VGGELADAAKTIGGAVHSVVDAARTASGGAVHSVVDAARTASGGVVSAVGEAGAKVAGTAADIGQNIAIRSRNAAIGALAGASATIGPAALNAGLGLISGGTAGAGVEAALTVGSGVVGGALQGAVENTKTDTHQVWHDAAATGNAASAALGTARAVKFGLSLGSKAVAAGYDTWKKAQAESAARDLASGVPGVSGKYTGGGKYTHSHDYDDIQGGAREVVPRARKIADALLDLQKIGVEMSDIEDLAKIIGAETVSESELIKSKYSDEEKSKMSEAGQAKSDGSYPIKDSEDVKNAVADYNRSGGSESDKEHIIARARAIGSEDCLPPSWGVGKSDDSSGGGNSDGGGAEKVSTADRLMKMIEDAGKLAEASLPDDADKLADQFLEILGKLSKASSKMSMDKVQAIHDHCADMGCKCGADKSVPAGDLEKLTSERDTLTETLNKMEPRIADILEKMKKQSEEIAKQSEEIQKLRKTALPPPRLHVIAKGEDVVFSQGDQSIDDLTKRVAGLSPAEKAELLVRMSLQNPQPMAGMRY